jgi:hypothetical protein
MAEQRTRWRNLHDQLAIENEALKKERDDAVTRAVELEQDVKARDHMIDELKRAVERAKLEGARGLADFMLGQSNG